MKVEFKSAVMDAIQFNNNYEKVCEWVKKHYGSDFSLGFDLHKENPEHPCVEIQMCLDTEEFNIPSFTEVHYVELYDYIVCLPTGELSLYDEIWFDKMFNRL